MTATCAPEETGIFTLETMIPDLLARFPHTRSVLDRYGLHGCGGRNGPVESLRFFARAHGVDETRLMEELLSAREDSPEPHANTQLAQPARTAGLPSAYELSAPDLADTIYRRFFMGGIALILTLGATWGAMLLWKIGFAGKFTGVSIHEVNAHGHAQIFGWVGLFIMGFAYQAFPRIWHTRLFLPKLAAAAFALMATGLVTATIGMTLSGHWSGALALATFGGLLELVAVLVFVAQILATFRLSGAKLEPYVGFVIAALVWFVAMTVMNLTHTWNTMHASTRDELLYHVKTYQAPLRDLQIHGLALFMILGVSLRMLPGLFDVPKVADGRAWKALALLTAGVIGEVVLYIAYALSGNHVLAAGLMVPWILLAIGIALVVSPWRLWRALPTSDRSGKFVRAAYAWLAVSMVMLLLLPVYQVASGIPFSHAYYGAIRHAITVGFVSLMIMGFAAKVVPTLNGVDPRTLTRLWGPFVLVNLGCFLRCSTQTLTDFYPSMFAVVGISGTLEVTGLAWWGIGLIRIICRSKHEERALLRAERQAGVPAASRTGLVALPVLMPGQSCSTSIAETDRVADVLERFPKTLEVFLRHGFTLLNQPFLRRTLARQVTLREACALRGVDLSRLVTELRSAV